MKKYALKDIIKKSKLIHGDKYDYSKANFVNVKTKMVVICPIHGEFEITPDNHINGKSGCPKCAGVYKYTSQEWIDECNIKHNCKYDYSKTVYKNAKSKVKIICHEKDEFGVEHGEFEIRASNHISGIGCPKCGNRFQFTKDDFLSHARLVHGDKYDYSKTDYKNSKNKIKIICHEKDEFGVEHGEFEQNAGSHLRGCGCPKCNHGVKDDRNIFIKKSKLVHGDRYGYDKVNYINAREKVIITCPKHGDFKQIPEIHLRGCGCPKCKSSKLENIVIKLLKKLNIEYVYQSKILEIGNQTVDFYIPSKNIIIECQGEQHFTSVRFSNKQSIEEAENNFQKQLLNDENKYIVAQRKNIKIIYFTIPKYFIQNDVNIFQPYYQDKLLFTDKNLLTDYLINCSNINKVKDFYDDINNVLGKIGINRDNNLCINNFVIKYVDYSDEEDEAIKIYHSLKKRNYYPIIIFPDEYHYKREIVLNKIQHIIHYENADKLPKIYARKCVIKEVTDYNEVKDFLEKNHLQSYVASTLYLGAYYNSKLVGVMSFLKEDKNGSWNLTRFATDNKYVCCGIGGKLFKYFTNHYEFNTIKSFADRRWTYNECNNIYTKLGFKLDGITCKDYRYYNTQIDKYQRYHKFGFRKNILNKKYGLPLTMTENEMTQQLGYKRIYDCGLFKYIFTKQ